MGSDRTCISGSFGGSGSKVGPLLLGKPDWGAEAEPGSEQVGGPEAGLAQVLELGLEQVLLGAGRGLGQGLGMMWLWHLPGLELGLGLKSGPGVQLGMQFGQMGLC